VTPKRLRSLRAVIFGDMLRVRITEADYEAEFKDCSTHLQGRVTMLKNDVPLTTQALKLKLKSIWTNLSNWSVTPLARGCFEFTFNSIADMRQALAQGTITLRPGIPATNTHKSGLD